MSNFDYVAPVYDPLSRLIFGNTLQLATSYHLPKIPQHSRVLIFGGGTGKILEALDQLNRPLNITYVEASEAMISRSKSRLPLKNLDITFYWSDAAEFADVHGFDVIITAFFMDCFTDDQLMQYTHRWSGLVKAGGRWIFTDFMETKRHSQRLLVSLMYAFFYGTAGLSTTRLPKYEKLFTLADWQLLDQKSFFGNLISSRIYQKS